MMTGFQHFSRESMTQREKPTRLPVILVVDDDGQLVESLIQLLELTGRYTVLFAYDACDGLRLLQDQPPDLIIADVVMPDMDGYEFLSQVRTHDQWKHIPFIFISGMTRLEDIQAGMMRGANTYLLKPFEPSALLSEIDKALH
jgi:CheY-like chemotaxis protein